VKRMTLIGLGFALLAMSVHADEAEVFKSLTAFATANSSSAETIVIPGTGITFDPPPGFTPLTQAEIDLKFPNKKGPQFAYGNDRRSTTVAYKVDGNLAITAHELREGLGPIGDSMARVVPGAIWIERKMINLGGADWAYFELTSNAIDTDIHNILLMGVWDGKLVVFNFNATKSDFVQLESALKTSLSSIKVENQSHGEQINR
jgi:hypothetical protein